MVSVLAFQMRSDIPLTAQSWEAWDNGLLQNSALFSNT